MAIDLEDNTKYDWYRIAQSADGLKELQKGEDIITVKAAGKLICIVNSKNGIYALNSKCPHAGGPLGEGFIDGNGHIVCPWHRYKFDPATGRSSGEESYYVKCYPINETGEGIFVGIPKKRFGLL